MYHDPVPSSALLLCFGVAAAALLLLLLPHCCYLVSLHAKVVLGARTCSC